MLDADLNPCAQELQFDLYDYDPRGMEGQPTTVSPIHSSGPITYSLRGPIPKGHSHLIGLLSLTWI